jgi:hypothetical protein
MDPDAAADDADAFRSDQHVEAAVELAVEGQDAGLGDAGHDTLDEADAIKEEGEKGAAGTKSATGRRRSEALRAGTHNWTYLRVLGMPNPAQSGARRWRLGELAARASTLSGKAISRDTASAGMRRVFKKRGLADVVQTGKQHSYWQLTAAVRLAGSRSPRAPQPWLTCVQGVTLATHHDLLSADLPEVEAGAAAAWGSDAPRCPADAGAEQATASGERTDARFAHNDDGSGFLTVTWAAGAFPSAAEAFAAALATASTVVPPVDDE